MASESRDYDRTNPDANPDAITGAPGSHPIGTGVGAAGGGAAGAAIGAAVSGPAFPVGAVVGAVVGAIAGGLAGKGAAEAVNPTAEDEYWRANHNQRPYFEPSYSYDEDYRPAYEYGWTARSQLGHQNFDEVESDLGSHWNETKSNSRLGWDKAKHAARDAWDRIAHGSSKEFGTTSSSSRDNMSGGVGEPQAYPGHDSEVGDKPSSVSATGQTTGGDMSSGFSGQRNAGMDDRTGGVMGAKIGGKTDVDRT